MMYFNKSQTKRKTLKISTARVFITIALLLLPIQASATWSIIVIDSRTGAIGIAGASCSPNCYGIGTIIPGKGAVIVQAMSNSDARALGVELMMKGTAPDAIIRAMRDAKLDPELQQYAVVTINQMNPVTYTGDSTHTYRGAITKPGISVQGNTLTNDQVLKEVMAVALQAQSYALSLEDILMKALEAGSDAGGDNRCGEQRATSAFITIFRNDDSARKPFLDLNTFGQHKGGSNAVVLLRKRYDKWKKNQ